MSKKLYCLDNQNVCCDLKTINRIQTAFVSTYVSANNNNEAL